MLKGKITIRQNFDCKLIMELKLLCMGRGLVDNNKLECHFDNCAARLGFVVVDILGRMGEVLVVVVGEVGVPGGRVGNLH